MSVAHSKRGFTLLEILIVMALIAILIGIVIAALNPARQFGNARNSTRYAHLSTIMSAISANMAENNGTFTCVTGALPASATNMADDDGSALTTEYDIAPCLVTDFLSSMPYDPSDTDGHWTDTTDYDAGYSILQAADGRVTISAPSAELSISISLTR